jgi:hypothetical protein
VGRKATAGGLALYLHLSQFRAAALLDHFAFRWPEGEEHFDLESISSRGSCFRPRNVAATCPSHPPLEGDSTLAITNSKPLCLRENSGAGAVISEKSYRMLLQRKRGHPGTASVRRRAVGLRYIEKLRAL